MKNEKVRKNLTVWAYEELPEENVQDFRDLLASSLKTAKKNSMLFEIFNYIQNKMGIILHPQIRAIRKADFQVEQFNIGAHK